MRKILLFVLITTLFAGYAIAEDLLELFPVIPHQKGPVFIPNELDELDTLVRFPTGAINFYLGSGGVGDTFAVPYEPAGPCSIYFAEGMFYLAAGDIESFIWDYSEDAEEEYEDGQAPNRGTSEVSPLGEVMAGGIEREAAAVFPEWDTMFEPDDLEDGGVFWEGDSMFMVGWVKTTEGAVPPHPLAEDVVLQDRRYTYSWFGGPWTADDPLYEHTWGAYSSDLEAGTVIELLMRVGIAYVPIMVLPQDTAEVVHDFGNVQLDSSETWELIIINRADVAVDLVVSTVTSDEEAFEPEEVDDLEIEAGDTALVEITFTPTEMIEYTGEIEIISSAGDRTLQVTGAGISPVIEVPVLDHDYGDVIVDSTETWEMWILNVGNDTLFVYSIESNNGAFEAVEFDTTAIDPGDSVSVNISFTPARTVEHNAELTITSNDPENGEVVVELMGMGIAAELILPEDAHDFGEIYTDSTETWEMPVVNGGDVALTIISIESDNDVFVVVDFAESVIEPGDTAWQVISFTPVEIMVYEGILTVTGNDPGGALTVTLTGTGLYYDIIRSGENAMPEKYSVSAVYPNPFNPVTTIRVALPDAADLKVQVFNTLGGQVATLVDGRMSKGYHNITFDASGFSSGIYIVRAAVPGKMNELRKVVLVK